MPSNSILKHNTKDCASTISFYLGCMLLFSTFFKNSPKFSFFSPPHPPHKKLILQLKDIFRDQPFTAEEVDGKIQSKQFRFWKHFMNYVMHHLCSRAEFFMLHFLNRQNDSSRIRGCLTFIRIK